MNEQQWDKKLKINTIGRDASHEDQFHFPYEPTPFSVLKRLVESGYLTSKSRVIDYGCGKGRVGFFLNHELGCQVTGVEYDEKIYGQAQRNLETYAGRTGVNFVCANAEEFQIKEEDNFYFFNPFSVEILQSVLDRILESYYEKPRQMQFFFYYPNEEYLAYLMGKICGRKF